MPSMYLGFPEPRRPSHDHFPLAEPPAALAPAATLNRSTTRRWAWLATLTIGLMLFELVRWACQATGNPNLVPSLLILGATTVPVSFAVFFYGLDTRIDVSALTVVTVALVGGVIGVITAGLLEYDTLRRLGTLPMLAVAVIEEASKLIAPAVALAFARRVSAASGLVLGVACGAGFAVLETLGYSAVALLQSHENLSTVDALLFQRGLFSPATHMTWTGVTAAALWSAAQQRWSGRSIGVLVGAFVFAVGLHAAWDNTNSVRAYLLLAAASLALLAAVTRWAIRAQAAASRRSTHD
jgi:protease PrsW